MLLPLALLDTLLWGAVLAEALAILCLLTLHYRTRRRVRALSRTLRRHDERALGPYRMAARVEVADALRAWGTTARLPLEFRAQYGEDVLLWNLFRGQRTGYYVEAGAYDGVLLSVTYVFEALGWTGLLVEPNPERFRECVASRPGSRVLNAALSRPGAASETTLQVVRGAGGLDLLSTVGPSERHRARVQTEGGVFEPVAVPMTTLEAALVGAAAPATVDFAVIDVEGHELDVLAGTDLARRAPRVLVVEDNSNGRERSVDSYLTSRGYRRAGRIGCNDVYVRETEPELLRRAQDWLG